MGGSTKLRAHPIADKSSELQRSWSVPWDFEVATSVDDENPQNGQGKPTQQKPTHWARTDDGT